MNFHVDIYQMDNSHIHVVLRGDAVGMASFSDSEAFIRFVEACKEFVEKNGLAANGTRPPIEQTRQLYHPIPDIFLEAFPDDKS